MSNRPAQPLPTVRQIERTPGYLTSIEYDPSRYCRGQRGLCSILPQWVITYKVHRGWRRSYYCDGCLPPKHRAATEGSQ